MKQGVASTQCLVLLTIACVKGLHNIVKHEEGTLTGDVQNWATLIENYVLKLASDGIKRDVTQSLLDQANYSFERKDGSEVVKEVQRQLGDYFSAKKIAAQKLADQIAIIHDSWYKKNTSFASKLSGLGSEVYHDSDIPIKLPKDMVFNPYFKQAVSQNHSTVKISDEVPRDNHHTISTVHFSAALEAIFKENSAQDPFVRWQYFGSKTGLVRIFPGREWDTNFAGFYNDYDPRVRPWYIAATSGPKDVVIVLDCSLSMKGGERFAIARAVAKNVIGTLTKQDYVNVVCARASHWNEVGKWHNYATEVLSCKQDQMVPATVAHRKDLMEKIDILEPGGTSELERGFEMAFELLQSKTRTGCLSIMVFITDGLDTDGEQVRCGPGYYTRSGYVPGPICKYNWTKVWDLVEEKNLQTSPKARIFSYLTNEKGEIFPGKLACQHRGTLKKLNSGENLISKMNDYFEFLSSNSMNKQGLWTSPYLDFWGLGLVVTHAVPVISNITGRIIGVAGVDATLEEIENFLSRYQWGSVYSFLINKQGETIFHPKLKPNTKLLDDPIFIPINQLEQDKDGKPAEFSRIIEDLKAGRTGTMRIENARKENLKDTKSAATYYYAALNDSEYAFAFSLADTDKIFRRSQEPTDHSKYSNSYFNLLIEYNENEARKQLPGVYDYLKVKYDEPKYPGLRVTYLHSSIFLAPKCHCDPNKYFYDDNLEQKTIDAHQWINSQKEDLGCQKAGAKYEKGIRADILITQPIEEIWKNRSFDSLSEVKWTYVGLRSGVFRTYPGHRSRRTYDPTKRPWYNRAKSAPAKTSISTAYMDAAGVGKIITISQAVFEGMTPRQSFDECLNISRTGPWPGGCRCSRHEDCIAGRCYLSNAMGVDRSSRRCATERVEAVTSLDILYNDFHNKTMALMEASDGIKSCGALYECPDGEPECQTRCYLFDTNGYLITDPDFLLADILDKSSYSGVTMGKKEGEVMKELAYKYHFFRRKEAIDFQGSCSLSPYSPRVTLEGLPTNPEEQDDYYKNKGPIPQFSKEFGCIQDVVGFAVNTSALGSNRMLTGNVTGPCMSGFYYVTNLPKTNLYLMVIENWKQYKETVSYPFNCKITQSIVKAGAYRIVNGTCSHQDQTSSTIADQGRCPALHDIDIPCTYNKASHTFTTSLLGMCILLMCAIRYSELSKYLVI